MDTEIAPPHDLPMQHDVDSIVAGGGWARSEVVLLRPRTRLAALEALMGIGAGAVCVFGVGRWMPSSYEGCFAGWLLLAGVMVARLISVRAKEVPVAMRVGLDDPLLASDAYERDSKGHCERL